MKIKLRLCKVSDNVSEYLQLQIMYKGIKIKYINLTCKNLGALLTGETIDVNIERSK
jgi:hypothetical protein